ncbi:hypothetical protein KIY81_gp55 [Mycobacterium phage Bugsy]|uniref:Uncharacterized protein n=1 Tax=Mycobacterium phage Bugsy TaxID=2656567 RepID=A0A649VE06_9CAUD|nr:hypothetical protein KIY81_gp55 [Mycobacterium phage Bugsy]AMB18527.1 hypothetical protein NASIATALIE_37 [Mycobacterium phage NaSiaTalie]AYD86312.1 hypothetical protein SEA_FLARE16_37 [Mycobacterium phage Flare16]QGJ90561.1 hypothetical protein SEA_BUGSY_39 [Mycobacterium phage Bugsy]QXN74066.1 hypothetical protein SEA_MICULUCIGAS_37 [Mycobacterium Phage MiculUcigas]
MSIVINLFGYELTIQGRRKPPGPSVYVFNDVISVEDVIDVLRMK